jgi:hypothetical protein
MTSAIPTFKNTPICQIVDNNTFLTARKRNSFDTAFLEHFLVEETNMPMIFKEWNGNCWSHSFNKYISQRGSTRIKLKPCVVATLSMLIFQAVLRDNYVPRSHSHAMLHSAVIYFRARKRFIAKSEQASSCDGRKPKIIKAGIFKLLSSWAKL